MEREGKESKYVLDNFNEVGINKVDVDLIVKEWSHLWSLYQYSGEFTIIRSGRKNCLKTRISSQQAGELIEKLGLGAEKAYPFRKAINWKPL